MISIRALILDQCPDRCVITPQRTLKQIGRLQIICLAAAVSWRAMAAQPSLQERGGLRLRKELLALLLLYHQDSCFAAEYHAICIAYNTAVKPSVCSLHS